MSDEKTVATLETVGRIAVLTIDNPPVNAIGQKVRQAVLDAIEAVDADDAVDALVIQCAGRTFIAGADIREFARPLEPPFLPELIDRVESSSKIVVAALHGTALGGGLELAMGCHYRIAVPSAKLGLPESKLGLMPGAGGTQRLPRLVGVPLALDMMTSANPIGADKALAAGLIDAIVQGDLRAEALAFAEAKVAEDAPVVRTRDRNEKIEEARGDPELFDRFLAANARKFRGLDAQKEIIDVVRSGLELPFAAAISRERKAFLRLRDGPQSKALRHIFFAEREAAKVADIPADTPTIPVNSVGIIGAGTMGTGIALAFLQAAIPVVLVEAAQDALDRGKTNILKTLDRNAATGRMTAQQAEQARGLLRTSLDYADLADSDLIVEAAYESLDVKRDIFTRLDAIARTDAILATNTSYLDVDAIAAATSRPDRVVGLHFFSPANIMKLLEIVRGRETAPQVIATALALAKRIGKQPVVARNAYGFIGNRMLAVRRREADKLILEGASPWDVDRVLVAFGMAMGPFQVSDLAGLDLGWTREASTGSTIRELLCEQDRRGRKTGAGFYDYDADGKGSPSPLTEKLIEELAARQGVVRRSFTDTEILEHLLYPMINEGAKILEDGIAQRASDVDVVWVHGYGWPSWRGGPMFHADMVGLGVIVEALHRLGGDNGELTPAPLLRRLAMEGRGFHEH